MCVCREIPGIAYLDVDLSLPMVCNRPRSAVVDAFDDDADGTDSDDDSFTVALYLALHERSGSNTGPTELEVWGVIRYPNRVLEEIFSWRLHLVNWVRIIPLISVSRPHEVREKMSASLQCLKNIGANPL